MKKWAAGEGLELATDEAIFESPRVQGDGRGRSGRSTRRAFKGYERVKRIALIAEDFTTQNGMLTPSLKLKRRVAPGTIQRAISMLSMPKRRRRTNRPQRPPNAGPTSATRRR